MQLKNQLLGLALLLLTFGCIDFSNLEDAKLPSYDAEFAVPLINSRLTIAEILDFESPVGTLEVNNEGTVELVYRGDILNRKSQEVLEQFRTNFPPVIPVFAQEQRLPLSLINGLDLDLLTFKSGDFSYYLENANQSPMSLNFELTSLVAEDGSPLTFSVNLDASDGSPNRPFASNQGNPIDLSGYRLIPENNEIVVRYTAQAPNGASLNASNFIIGFNNLDFSYVEGFLGQVAFPGGRDSVEIDVFENNTTSGIFFAEPQVRFFIENSFGVPTQAIVNDFFVESLSGERLAVESSLIETGVAFPFPALTQVGEVAIGEVRVDKNNSNIDDLLRAEPVRVVYDVDALINPNADSDIIGFLTDSSFFNVQMEVVLPLIGTADNVTATDTLEFDLGNIENIDSAEFKIITENELGIDVALQAYFLDDQKNVLDSLFTGPAPIIKAATVNASGTPTNVASVTTFVTYDEVRIERVEQAPFLVLEARFSTESNGQQFVRIQNTQGLNVRIGAILGVSND